MSITEMVDLTTLSLRDIRQLYFDGKIDWETYRAYEQKLTEIEFDNQLLDPDEKKPLRRSRPAVLRRRSKRD